MPTRSLIAAALLAVLAASSPLACHHNPPPPPADASPAGSSAQGPGDVIATVNGVPITEADVLIELRTRKSETALTPEQKKAVVNRLIQQELVGQKAVELGLDNDQAYRAELSRRMAELHAWQRQALSNSFFQHELKTVQVGDEEAKRYFDENAGWIRTEVHVWQILMRDEAQIAEAKKQLDGGASFEAVAKKQFPTIPEGQRPWDLPNLRWKQMPAAWRGAVERMKPGESSDVIRGEAGRFWIIKLIERSDDASATFEQEKAAIVEDLRLKKIEELRTKTAEDLRNAARIEYTSK